MSMLIALDPRGTDLAYPAKFKRHSGCGRTYRMPPYFAFFRKIIDVEGLPDAGDLTVVSVAAPSYHRLGYDGHTGGVGCLHLDR